MHHIRGGNIKMKWRIIVCAVCLCVFLCACGSSGAKSSAQTESRSEAAQTAQITEVTSDVTPSQSDNTIDISAKLDEELSRPFLSLTLWDCDYYSVNGRFSSTGANNSITDSAFIDVMVGSVKVFELSFASNISSDVKSHIEENGGYDTEVIYDNCEYFFENDAIYSNDSCRELYEDSCVYFPNEGNASVTVRYMFEDYSYDIVLNFNVKSPEVQQANISLVPNKVSQVKDGLTMLAGVGYNDYGRKKYMDYVFYFDENQITNDSINGNFYGSCNYIDNVNGSPMKTIENVCNIGDTVYFADHDFIYSVDVSDGNDFTIEPFFEFSEDYTPRNMFALGDNLCVVFNLYSQNTKNVIYLIDQSGEILNQSIAFEMDGLTYYHGNLYIAARMKDGVTRLYRVDLGLKKYKAVEPNSFLPEDVVPREDFFMLDGNTYYMVNNRFDCGIFKYTHNSGEAPINVIEEFMGKDKKPKVIAMEYYNNSIYYLYNGDTSTNYDIAYSVCELKLHSGENEMKYWNNVPTGDMMPIEEKLDTIVNMCGDNLYFITKRGIKLSEKCFIYRYNLINNECVTSLGIYY